MLSSLDDSHAYSDLDSNGTWHSWEPPIGVDYGVAFAEDHTVADKADYYLETSTSDSALASAIADDDWDGDCLSLKASSLSWTYLFL